MPEKTPYLDTFHAVLVEETLFGTNKFHYNLLNKKMPMVKHVVEKYCLKGLTVSPDPDLLLVASSA